jgi:hypothetical protein
MLKPKFIVITRAAAAAILVLSSIGIVMQNVAFAHQRQLFTIGDKDYLFVVGSLGEPLYVDQKSGVDFSAFWPDPSDPVNSRANGSRPIEGLENMLKVDVVAGDKNKTFDFEPAFMNPGHYEATFFPTVETTYNYTLFGNINGTDFRATWTCTLQEEKQLLFLIIPQSKSRQMLQENQLLEALVVLYQFQMQDSQNQ